ncbi:MAG: hypothetical protein ACSHXK_12030 [Oceanococcus sp.]
MDNEMVLMLTLGIIGVIAVMTVYALLSQRQGVAHNAPSILTSLGIFGTFLGITIGLAGFDPDNVQSSVSALFGGIKLAFWTSVAGILGGILVKFRHLFLFENAPESVSLDDLIAAMRGVEKSLTDENKQPLLASLRDIQDETRDQVLKQSESLEHLAGAADSAQERDQAVLEQLKSMDQAFADGWGSVKSANDQQLSELQQALNGLAQAMGGDSGKLLQQLKDMDASAANNLKTLLQSSEAASASMTEELKQLSEQLSSQLGDELSERLTGSAEQSAEATAQQLKSVAAAVQGLRAAMGDDSVALLKQLEQVKAGSDGLGQRLTDVLGEGNGNVVEAISRLQDAMSGDTAGLLQRMESLRSGSDALGERLSDVLGANNAALTQALQDNKDKLGAQIATAVSEIRDALIGPDGAASALGGALSQTMQEGQMELAKALARLSEGMRGALDQDLSQLNEQLLSGSERSAEEMQKVAAAIGQLQTAMGGDTESMLERMNQLRQGSEALGERLSEVLGANNAALANALEGNRDAMAAQVTTAVTDLRDALVGPDGAAKILSADLGARMQEGQMALAKALARTTDALRTALGEDAQAMQSRLESVDGSLSELADQFTGSINDLSENLRGAFGDMGGGLSGDINQVAASVADAIDDLRMAIVGPEGARDGIVEEMRTAHQGTDKRLQAIHQALQENTQRQVDYSPKGLMTVLEELIKQFNTQFAGQFWEKVGGFNQGIAELLEWMETYRTQLNDMVEQQGLSAQHMSTATRRFDEIASKSEIFVDVSRNISNLLGGIDGQRVQIESHLKRFAHIVDETGATLENIEQRIVAGNGDMNKHLSDIAERIEAQVIRVDRAMDDELRKALITFGQQLSALSEKFVEDYTPLTNRLREVVNIAREV